MNKLIVAHVNDDQASHPSSQKMPSKPAAAEGEAMHITNLLVKSVLSSALTLSSLSVFAAASSEHTGHNEHQHHSGHHTMQNMTNDHAQHTETVDAASYQPPPKLLHQPACAQHTTKFSQFCQRT